MILWVPLPYSPLPKGQGPEEVASGEKTQKGEFKRPNRHFALRCLEITDFACMQINVIFKSQFIRHIKNTCTNCTQNSHVFHTRFSHFFGIFFRTLQQLCHSETSLFLKQGWNPERQVYKALLHSKAADFRRKSRIFHLFDQADIKTGEQNSETSWEKVLKLHDF